MAGNAVIGALRVVLGADTALFESGLKQAQKDLDAFHRGVTQIGAAIGTAAVALGISLQNAINRADELGKMAQRIGIPVEELSRLRLAADLSGVSMESLSVAVGRLSRNMSQIAGGATNDASNAFRALGISVRNTDGTLKSSQQIMEEVADKFQRMQDGAGKTALAMAVFGRSGAQMIPMLNQGAAALREAGVEAEALGLVISSRTAMAAEAFNDNLRRLRLVTEGVALQVAAELSPALQLLTTQFVQSAKDGNVVKVAAEAISRAIQAVVLDVMTATIQFRNLGAELSLLGQIALAAATQRWGDLISAVQRWKNLQSDIGQQMTAVRQSFEDFNEQARMLADHFANVGNRAGQAAAPIIAAENALDKFLKTQTKTIAASQAEAATVGMVAGAREALRIVLQAEAVEQENNIRMTDKLRERIAFLAGEARFAALQTAGFQMVLENRTPLEQYQLALQNTEAAMRSVGATAEQIARAQEKAAERFGLSWSAIGTNIAGTAGALSQLSGTFAKENKAMGLASKAFGIAQAIINTQIAITKALATLPPPASYVAVALAVAQGAAAVASISAQKFSTGGMMRMALPPGSGADSQLLTARVRPDEQVDIWRPGEGPDQRRGGGGGFTVVQMQLPGGAAGRFIEELITDINGKIADGYRLSASAA